MTISFAEDLCFPEFVSEKMASTNDVHWHKIHGWFVLSSLKKIKLHIPWRKLPIGNVSTFSIKGWGSSRFSFCPPISSTSLRTVSTSLFSIDLTIFLHNGLKSSWERELGIFLSGILNLYWLEWPEQILSAVDLLFVIMPCSFSI